MQFPSCCSGTTVSLCLAREAERAHSSLFGSVFSTKTWVWVSLVSAPPLETQPRCSKEDGLTEVDWAWRYHQMENRCLGRGNPASKAAVAFLVETGRGLQEKALFSVSPASFLGKNWQYYPGTRAFFLVWSWSSDPWSIKTQAENLSTKICLVFLDHQGATGESMEIMRKLW